MYTDEQKEQVNEILINSFQENIVSLDKWYDSEIKLNFNIDIFSESFNPKTGYKIFTNNNFSLLLIRMENLNEVF